MKNSFLQVIELLLCHSTSSSGMVDVNARNDSGLTALDVLLMFPSEAGDREIAEILIGAGAKRGKDIPLSPDSLFHSTIHIPSASETPQTEESNCVEYFKFKKDGDSPSEARSILLIIAVLVATATFQAGINPPGGVWQDDSNSSIMSTSNAAHYAGRSILGSRDSRPFGMFVLFNSIGFSTSLLMINILTTRFPLRFELQICIVTMYCTYNTALQNIAPDNSKLYVIITTSVLFAFAPPLAKWIRINIKRIRDYVMNMVHRTI